VRLTTHVLDVSRGIPAAGLIVTLYSLSGGSREQLVETRTNADGRCDGPLAEELEAGTYELVFDAGGYYARSGIATFYDDVPVRFKLDGEADHYHVPLLVSPWGYSTYRGS
jgi:5-hydroxyisourate hydrolase